jgi:hypothetical protein
MPDDLESLCDLVEQRTGKYRVPLARLWERVFVAIRDGLLDFGFPDELQFEYGGRNPPPHYVKHIREIQCVNALFAIKNGDAFEPWKQPWVRNMLVSAAAFDKIVAGQKRRPGPESLVDWLVDFLEREFPEGVPPITNKQIVRMVEAAIGKTVSDRTVQRAKEILRSRTN